MASGLERNILFFTKSRRSVNFASAGFKPFGVRFIFLDYPLETNHEIVSYTYDSSPANGLAWSDIRQMIYAMPSGKPPASFHLDRGPHPGHKMPRDIAEKHVETGLEIKCKLTLLARIEF